MFAKYVNDKIDFDALALESDEAVIRSTLRRLDLDDVELGRALEVIRERKIALQDLKEANNELVESEQERIDLQRDITASDEAIVKRTLKASEDLEDDRIEIQIKGIDDRLENMDRESIEALRLLKEKNDLILQQQEKQLEKESEAKKNQQEQDEQDEKDAIARRQELLEKSVEVLDQIFAKSREKQNDALDKEIDTLETRIDDVKNAINNGNEDASQSLAELEKQRLEAEQKKEELRKKEIRDEKIIAGLQVLASNNGDVGKTVGDISLLLAALSNLPSFFDGTEDTGTVSNPLDSNGGRTAILHDNERVITAKQNERIGGISNDDLADLAQMHNNGNLNGGTTILQANNDNLILEVKEMTRAVKNIPIQSYNYDSKAKHHEQVIQTQNKKERLKTRASNLFK